MKRGLFQYVLEGRKMIKRFMDELIGKYCKIVAREPGENRAHVIFGILKNIDYNKRLVVIKSNPGLKCLSMESIVAMKPKNQTRI
jgi:hypothetical protein